MLHDEPSNSVFSKTYNTDFDELIITCTDQNGSPLKIKDKVNWTMIISKQKYCNTLQKQEQKNVLKKVDFYYAQENTLKFAQHITRFFKSCFQKSSP